MSQEFNTSAIERLKDFLQKTNQKENFEQLTPDASTREFFRVFSNNETAIACIYPEVFDKTLPQIDVTNLFLTANLPVAKIYEVNYDLGIVLHEDFGDKILRDVLESSDSKTYNELLNESISLIAKIQNSTQIAFDLKSVASILKFDEEKLAWELNFFKEHYFESLMKTPLSIAYDDALTLEFIELSRELENYATVLTHRDFHTANLMVDNNHNLRIIDHQDARLGSIAYDLVSLLLDRITELPKQTWLKEKKEYFLFERENIGLESTSYEKFNYEFELMTIQRCLKAIGTFSNQAGNYGKQTYLPYINPMFQIVLDSCQRLQRFENLQKMIRRILL